MKRHFDPLDQIFPLVGFCALALLVCCRLPGLEGWRLAVLPLLLTLLLAAALWGLHRLPRQYLLPLTIATGALLLLRLYAFPVETSDYTDFLRPWTDWFRKNGGLRGLGREIGNYNVPYLVLLALFSYLDFPELYLIKLSSVAFDLLLAFAVYELVRLLTRSPLRSALGFGLTLLLPTVFLNGAVWGQCDSIYISLGLLSLYCCLSGKPCASMLLLGLSFSFKLQAVFIIPVFLPCLLSGRLKWRQLPLFPAAYLAAVSPALLFGRPFGNTLLFYLRSASTVGNGLNYNSPSLYALPAFYHSAAPEKVARLGILLAAALCLAVALLFLLRRNQASQKALCYAALLLCCGIPLLLPHMHDRYFYFCDVLSLVLACTLPLTAPLVLLSQFASLLGYHAYFFMRYLLPMRFGFFALALLSLAVLGLLLYELFRPPLRQSGRNQGLS